MKHFTQPFTSPSKGDTPWRSALLAVAIAAGFSLHAQTNALSFDGVNDRVDCGSSPSLDLSSNTMTVEAWIYPTAWQPMVFFGNIINKEQDSNGSGYMLRCGDNGKINLSIGDGSSFHQLTAPASTLTLNTWQHVAGTYDGTTARLYVNGVEVVNSEGTFNIGSNENPLVIGDWSNGSGGAFPGKIDEVRVWNKAIGADALLAHMNTAYCGNETGLVAYYRFDQGIANGANSTATTLSDMTGYANNGTLTGFALNGTASNWTDGVTGMGDCVPVACPTPIAVTITNANVNSFDLSWTDSGAPSYKYEVRTSGEPGSGPTGLVANGSPASGTPAISVSGLAANTTYYAYVRAACSGSLFSDWSPATVSYVGYCLPAPSSVDNSGIANVSFAGVDNSTGTEDNNYGNYSDMVGIVQQATTVTVNITFETGYTYDTKVWVDWNDDLDFDDAGENVFTDTTTSASPTTLVATFPVGSNPIGQHRMRIGGVDTGSPTPCYTGTYGTFEDYTLQVDPEASCVPPTDLITTGLTPSSVDFAWTASISDPVDGYQWEVRSSGAPGSGSDGLDAGGSTTTDVINDGAAALTNNIDYSVYVRGICGGGDTSNWTAPTNFHTGYCIPTSTDGNSYFSNFFTTGGASNIANATDYAPNGYGDYTSQVVSRVAGFSINWFTTTVGAAVGTAIWVDWNNDLDFNDPGEKVFTTTDYAFSQSGTITVPAGTPVGSYRMRIRCNAANPMPDACGLTNNTEDAETEDYTFQVVNQCAGTPDPGATVGPTAVCAEGPFTVAVQNYSSDAGIAYHWQVSTNGTVWTNAPGTNTLPFYSTSQSAETWYRLQVTCVSGGVGNSTPLDVTMAPISDCYCNGVNFTSAVQPICNVTFADIDNDSPGIEGSPALEDFTSIVGHVEPGMTYTFSATGNTAGNQTDSITAFFDWDGNGIWETVVPIGSMTNAVCATPTTAEVTVPLGAVIGTSRMRVVKNLDVSPMAPCDVYESGQAEDYTIDVVDVSGIEELTDGQGITVYPNPASTTLFITTPTGAPVHVKVYDMVGTLVMVKDMVEHLDITKLATGSYTLVATDAKGGNEQHARFMKQ